MSRSSILIGVVVVLAAASSWFYIDHILVPHQVADAAAHDRPRGNFSDLYPRWLGARELLLHGRNPYSREITKEIQRGYYGRELDASRPEDPKDQAGFAYPVYVVFLLAPWVGLPFGEVRIFFFWMLMAVTAASFILWLRLLSWKLSCVSTALCALLLVCSLPAIQGLKLQQLTLLVAGLLAACAACLNGGWLIAGGALLALATIKPQLVWPLAIWLLCWAGREWRSRGKFVLGFGVGMVLLFAGAEIVLPGWLRMFVQAMGQYRDYTNESILQTMLGAVFGRICEVLAILACIFCVRRSPNTGASSAEFGRAFALLLALTVLIVPMFALYNQVLLTPAVLMLVRDTKWSRATSKLSSFVFGLAALLFMWPWLATLGLSIASFFLSAEKVQSLWQLPLHFTFAPPVFIFGLAMMQIWGGPRDGLRAGAATA